ncbi:NAD-dependent epimerase/dehydratase family protein [Spirosoma foliorum]|uniref:NAD-dependent epimerase/dehydratase family protein n=1 Tax=Spirosoma foliorum TaxID=2710596 RepID=A0A7G5GYP5_9BACT|nr:NAD-dependent epimerase/dehydratase family protein [Spirosoma foliorum]QMW03987.1 NAD-dependent epimerase/dehydratase family protein [Spirosoma foliorum]
MNILLSGGAGFIGSHLANQLLTTHCTVHVLDNFFDNYNPAHKWRNIEANLVNSNYYLHQGDICHKETLEKLFQQYTFDTVVHLAALAGVQASFQQPATYTAVNVEGTRNLLEVMRTSGVRKLIYCSSSSVYGESCSLPLQENCQPLLPISPYALTKYQGEKLCKEYHEQVDIEVTCLRFFTVYGPRQRPDMAISQFLKALLQQCPLTIYGEGSSRDYTYVADIVQGNLPGHAPDEGI